MINDGRLRRARASPADTGAHSREARAATTPRALRALLDSTDVDDACARVLRVLLDGRWHGANELCDAAREQAEELVQELPRRERGYFDLECDAAAFVDSSERPGSMRHFTDDALARSSLWRITRGCLTPERVRMFVGLAPPRRLGDTETTYAHCTATVRR